MRLATFKVKGVDCKYCKRKGEFFTLEYDASQNVHSLQLYSGTKDKKMLMTCDHIIPLSKGGSNSLKNTQTLCSKCNSIKSNHSDEMIRFLINKVSTSQSTTNHLITDVQSLLKERGNPRPKNHEFAYGCGAFDCGECGRSIVGIEKIKYLKSLEITKSYTFYLCGHKKSVVYCSQKHNINENVENFSKELIYTGITRAKKNIKIISTKNTILKILSKRSVKISAISKRLEKDFVFLNSYNKSKKNN